MEMSRNAKCWCGSGKKHKQCHEAFDKKYEEMKKQGYHMPDRSLIRNENEIKEIQPLFLSIIFKIKIIL